MSMNAYETSTRNRSKHMEHVRTPVLDRSEGATTYQEHRHEDTAMSSKAREVEAEETEESHEGEDNEEYDEESDEESDETPSLPSQSFASTMNSALPEIPNSDFSSDFLENSKFSSFMNSSYVATEKVNRRTSNVMKLTQENEKLQAELKAMAERLDAMERRRAQLIAAKEPKILEEPPS